MTTFADLLPAQVRRDPGRPFLTFYDVTTGERTELSLTTYANWVAKAAGLVVREGVQMHGGIGMTDEYDIGFYLKRARVLEASWGSTSYLKDRFAKLSSY